MTAGGHTPGTRLHSLQTTFLKTVFPVFWIGGFAAGTLALFLGAPFRDAQGLPPPPWMKWVFLLATIVGSGLIWWFCVRLKYVRMDDRFLYLTDLGAEATVPLTEVDGVTENRWINIHPVTIHFLHETPFGSQVTFMPKLRLFAFWSGHPVVDEILEAAARARGE